MLASETSIIVALVLSNEGPLSRSDPSTDRARAGRTGAPRNGRRLRAKGGAPGGAAPSLGRARSPGRGRRVRKPRLKGVPNATPLAPPAAPPPSRGSRGILQTSDAPAPRECESLA